MSATAVIAAGGSGIRLGQGLPKQFLPILGIPLIIHTLKAFQKSKLVDRIVVALPKNDIDRLNADIQRRFRLDKLTTIAAGGASRQESVLSGLRQISWPTEFVAVHDGARCLITPDLIDKTVAACQGWDGAIMGMPVRDTLKKVAAEKIEKTEPRENLWGMQTPQVFRFPFIREAYEKAEKEKFEATDDAQVAEWFGGKVRVVEGTTQNIKVTFPEDLKLAEVILREREASL